MVDTGNLPGDVDYFTLFGGELAGVYGPFSAQGEYLRADVDRDTGGDLGFDGYYGYVSWFLTGESRNYRPDRGVFDILQPHKPFSLKSGAWGAWELAVRYSGLDLSDETVGGGEIDAAIPRLGPGHRQRLERQQETRCGLATIIVVPVPSRL